jgi:hypothetical protein
MRPLLIAALSATAFVAMASSAIAEMDQSTRDPAGAGQGASRTHAGPNNGENVPGIIAEQERAIPYHPCVEANDWVNGRLRCNND